jgi:hypothetical protein
MTKIRLRWHFIWSVFHWKTAHAHFDTCNFIGCAEHMERHTDHYIEFIKLGGDGNKLRHEIHKD